MKDLSSFDSAFTSKLNEIIFANLENEHFGVNELAGEIGLSRFKLNSKLHFIYRKTINQYIREVRLMRAMELLQQESVTASEVAFKVGFSSPAYFSTCFSEYYGFPPGEVKKRGLINSELNQNQAVTEQSKKKKRIKRAIAIISFTILLTIVGVYLFNNSILENFNFFTANQLKKQKKSIAVLPFINDSKDSENVYFINGVMEAILDNLSKIEDLEVRPRTSVEQYRSNKTKMIPQIARELGVNYIIEGSGQKIGNQVSLYIQLIEASSNKHLFSHQYSMKLEDIFNLQSEVAIKIASEINAMISIEEKKLINKKPTTNFAAMNSFLQANDIHNIAVSEGKWELDHKAERLYKRAIKLDSTYADPYAALGWIISNRNIDSALFLANRAIHFNTKNAEAFTLKGYLYWNKGMEREAEKAYKQSIKYKPNNSTAFRYLGELYFYQGKCYNAIENQLKAFHQENNSLQERNNLKIFSSSLYSLGFYKEGGEYAAKLLEQNNDSSYYYWGLTTIDLDRRNYKSALKSALKMYACDTEDLDNIYLLFYTYLYLRDFDKASLLMQKYIVAMKKQGRKIEPDYLLGFAYFENGQKEEADFHFNGVIKKQLDIIKQNQPTSTCFAYLALAKIYSVRNEKTKALENLQKVKDCLGLTIIRIKDYKNCTMLDNIRHESGFAAYIKEAEARYQKEHNKVEKLLRAEGIIDLSVKK
ncbi:MAG: helix-turn-helix domain-containing protein [Flavobacteriaceae bacterium]|nr:helix-turn-helix domain-containing protein [Flavobacteriaceae bacterium]